MKKIIQEWEIERAAQAGKPLLIDEQTRLTPAAADRAKELSVPLQKVVAAPRNQPIFKDIFPVKRIALASDHGGFAVKEMLRAFLSKQGYRVLDLGPSSDAACNYPDYAFKVAEAVSAGRVDRGIMVDSVGIGSAMAANRIKGVLAAKCNNGFEAHSAREHNYANVLTLGGKVLGSEVIKEIVTIFLTTKGGAERHRRRVEKILKRDEKK